MPGLMVSCRCGLLSNEGVEMVAKILLKANILLSLMLLSGCLYSDKGLFPEALMVTPLPASFKVIKHTSSGDLIQKFRLDGKTYIGEPVGDGATQYANIIPSAGNKKGIFFIQVKESDSSRYEYGIAKITPADISYKIINCDDFSPKSRMKYDIRINNENDNNCTVSSFKGIMMALREYELNSGFTNTTVLPFIKK